MSSIGLWKAPGRKAMLLTTALMHAGVGPIKWRRGSCHGLNHAIPSYFRHISRWSAVRLLRQTLLKRLSCIFSEQGSGLFLALLHSFLSIRISLIRKELWNVLPGGIDFPAHRMHCSKDLTIGASNKPPYLRHLLKRFSATPKPAWMNPGPPWGIPCALFIVSRLPLFSRSAWAGLQKPTTARSVVATSSSMITPLPIRFSE